MKRLFLCLALLGCGACTKGVGETTPTAVPPGLVTNLEVAKATDGQVLLRWDLPSPAPDAVVIDRNGSQLTKLSGTASHFVDKSVDPGTRYTYEVSTTSSSLTSDSVRAVTKTGVPSVSEARIDGVFAMTFTLLSTNVTGTQPNASKGKWSLIPVCPQGPCDLKLDSLSGKYTVRLAWSPSGQRYRGAVQRKSYYTCGTTNLDAVEQVVVNADKAKVVNGEWVAIRIRGQLTFDQNENSSCFPQAHEEFAFTGTLPK